MSPEHFCLILSLCSHHAAIRGTCRVLRQIMRSDGSPDDHHTAIRGVFVKWCVSVTASPTTTTQFMAFGRTLAK